jgi:hypothetical protein
MTSGRHVKKLHGQLTNVIEMLDATCLIKVCMFMDYLFEGHFVATASAAKLITRGVV